MRRPPLTSAPSAVWVAGVRGGRAPAAARPPRSAAVPSSSSSRGGTRGHALHCAEPPTAAQPSRAARVVPPGAFRGVVSPAGAATPDGRRGGEAAVVVAGVVVVHGRREEVVLELDDGDGLRGRVAARVARLARAAGHRSPQVHAALVHHHHLHAPEGTPAGAPSCRGAAAAPDLVRAGRLRGEAALVLGAAGPVVGAAALVLRAAPPIVQHASVAGLMGMSVGVRRQEFGRDTIIVTVRATTRNPRLVPLVRPLPSPQTHHKHTRGPTRRKRQPRIYITQKTWTLFSLIPVTLQRASRRPQRTQSRSDRM